MHDLSILSTPCIYIHLQRFPEVTSGTTYKVLRKFESHVGMECISNTKNQVYTLAIGSKLESMKLKLMCIFPPV